MLSGSRSQQVAEVCSHMAAATPTVTTAQPLLQGTTLLLRSSGEGGDIVLGGSEGAMGGLVIALQ